MEVLQALQYADIQNAATGFSKLFADYLSNPSALKRFYQHDFRSPQSFRDAAEARIPTITHRELLAEVLEEQNQRYGAGDATFRNITSLREPRTVAVVTGQQVGMLGGPLYTIYKTITAIKLARSLQEQMPDIQVVPVFWLEGEDHDFDEINKVLLLSQEGAPVSLEYLPKARSQQSKPGPVGQIAIDGSIDAFFEAFGKGLTPTEFRDGILQQLRSIYTAQTTLGNAFASLLQNVFADEGLVIIDASDRRLKKLLRPLFANELETFPSISQLIIRQSALLEEEYHAQIKTKAMNLFLLHNGGRYLIEPREHDFALRGTRQYFTKEELFRILDETPEAFSPNVALRPLCQDMILPTVAYVGGPSEIAYFAQLKPVYDHFRCPLPVIYPRASATIVEERQLKVLEKFQLDIADAFRQTSHLQQHVIDLVSEVNIDQLFQQTGQYIADQIQEMRFGLTYVDPTLSGPLESTRERIDAALQALHVKASEAQIRKHETSVRQIQKVQNFFFPNGDYQERALNLFYFMNKYGNEFIPWLNATLAIDQFHHQILYR